MFLVFSNYFDVLMSKMIFKKSKNIIDMHFSTKSYLKNNRNYTTKKLISLSQPQLVTSQKVRSWSGEQILRPRLFAGK